MRVLLVYDSSAQLPHTAARKSVDVGPPAALVASPGSVYQNYLLAPYPPDNHLLRRFGIAPGWVEGKIAQTSTGHSAVTCLSPKL